MQVFAGLPLLFGDKPMFQGKDNRFQSIVNMQFLQDVADVVSGRRRTDGERPGNVIGIQPLCQQG